jgi:hypothetical protein
MCICMCMCALLYGQAAWQHAQPRLVRGSPSARLGLPSGPESERGPAMAALPMATPTMATPTMATPTMAMGDTCYGDAYYGYGRHLLWRHLLWLWATLAMATSAGLPYTESYAYRLPPPARTLTLTLTLTLPRPDVRGVVRLLACRVLQEHHRREVRQGVPLRDPLPVRPRGKAPGLEPALMRQDHQRTR